jgi:hypothetical protein
VRKCPLLKDKASSKHRALGTRRLSPKVEKVITEGAEIYCERRDNGALLLLITGAMEGAGFYSSTAIPFMD